MNVETENGDGSARDTSNTTRFLFKLSVPCPVRLHGSREAHCVVSQPLQVRRLRRVAAYVNLSWTPLHLEQLSS